jgi:hypothetical protein
MKNLSNEELIGRIKSQAVTDFEDGKEEYSTTEAESELLSRLNRLDEVEKENKKWKEMYAGIMADKHILIVENENLKCCGNCRINCNCESFFRGWHKYCDQWQSDSMTREEREK